MPPLAWFRDFGRPPRIMGLDIARGLAILGMMGAHLDAPETLDLFRPETWGAVVHGRSSILFAVLAGVSIAILSGRTEPPSPHSVGRIRLGLVGRGSAIFAAGLALEILNTGVAVILTVYGLLYIAALPFLRWPPARLLLAASLLAVLGPPLLAGLYAVSLGASGPGLDFALFGAYPLTVWMTFLLGGMALGRMRLDRRRTAACCLVAGIALSVAGYGLGALASPVPERDSVISPTGPAVGAEPPGTPYAELLAEQMPLERMAEAFFLVEPHSGGTAEVLGSGGLAVAIVGLSLLLAQPLRRLLLPLAALGSMPLTAYSIHIITLACIINPLGDTAEAAWGWSSIALLSGAVLWSACFGRGPLERLVARAARATAGPA